MVKFMLDTDISIYTVKRKPHEVRRMFNIHAGEMSISTMTQGSEWKIGLIERIKNRLIRLLKALLTE